ncbi:MAG: NAD(P)H-hydrate dehydratase [Oscillospiraceae bacterium]|nr:NAD(P)H-hydrate dehydratase [Oscillospiraceae bacterium]
MKPILSVENMRLSDAWTCANLTPSRELMYRAGLAVFQAAEWKGPVALVCGSGNNAGDGYVIASLLAGAQIPCRVFLLKEKFTRDGRYYYDLCRSAGVAVELLTPETDLSSYATVVDCLLGTGFSGALRPEMQAAIQAINRSGAYVIAVDINSGLNGDNGLCTQAVRSNVTFSLGSPQPGHYLGDAKDYIGCLKNLEIGIPPLEKPYRLVEAEDVTEFLGKRKNNSHKGSYGYLALVGGSLRYSGAIRLANLANSAMRSGAGVVKLALPRSLCPLVVPHILESTLFPLSESNGEICFVPQEMDELLKNTKACAFGMGIGNSSDTALALEYILKSYTGTLIIDADGLNALSAMDPTLCRSAACRLVLTPHPKEFSRLSGKSMQEIREDPIGCTIALAKALHAVVLLKGPTTVISDGDEVYLSSTGCAGMATAGSGDVLSGILAALCALHPDRPAEAAAAAAWVNGRAGELAQGKNGPAAMTAGDTALCVRDVVAELCPG